MKKFFLLFICILTTSLYGASVSSYSSISLTGNEISISDLDDDILFLIIANRKSSKVATDTMQNIGKQIHSVQKDTSIRFISIIDLSDLLSIFHPMALRVMKKQYNENIAFFSHYYTNEKPVFASMQKAETYFRSIIDFVPEAKVVFDECKAVDLDSSCVIVVLDKQRNVFYSKKVTTYTSSINTEVIKKIDILVNQIEKSR